MQRIRDRLLLNGIQHFRFATRPTGRGKRVLHKVSSTLHSGSEEPYQTCRIDSVVNRALN
ncbi:hypothetical protein ALC62_02591 [Cyphomyrmex costatus]|uniref:Uncharacterized protein n=1 Tax=Cyphomyrmex costatus TaxID=456900 RepID=A0A195D0X2_9HYME|nr:hypothetical protein ALC62_02591 [Cyphomyrmex costatus]